MKESHERRAMWTGVWGYGESIAITAGMFLAGLFLGYFLKMETEPPSWPLNLYLGLSLAVIIVLAGTVFRKSDTFKWLSGTKNAIVAISCYLLIVILLGFIPQTPPSDHILYHLGFSHLLSSQVFLFAQVYLLLSLGMVTVRRLNKFNVRNIAFFINHFGLWLALFAISLGAGDLKTVRMEINKVYPQFEGIYPDGEPTGDMGLAIQLKDFSIDFFLPKAYVIDASSGELVYEDEFLSLGEGASGKIGKWNIRVEKFAEYAIGMEGEYHAIYEIGAAPAAFVYVNSEDGTVAGEGWLSCGSFRFPGNYLKLNNDQLLVMAEPEAKRYESKIRVYTRDGDPFDASLTVGRPVRVNGWKVYQSSYDASKGRWSEISIIELVKDPWIDLVYSGLIMMVLGALYLIFTGKRKQG